MENNKQGLVNCIHFLHQKGYAPATSSNYSFREKGSADFFISASGLDKGEFQESDLVMVDYEGKAVGDETRKTSAETLLHVLIYKQLDWAGCILHTHTVFNTVLSEVLKGEQELVLEGLEIMKAFRGVSTHETSIKIPIFENSQDMKVLSHQIQSYWKEQPDMLGFLLAGHGFYTWGETIAAAKRSIEAFEFLFECYYRMQVWTGLRMDR